MSKNSGYEYTIESVENAAKTLLLLREHPTIRVTDVAAQLGVVRSTAHRMVSTLVQSGLLRRNIGDKTFSAGFALVELGMAVIGAADIRAEVQPVLTQLSSATGETAHFLVREGSEALFVAVAEGTHAVRAVSRVGTRLPLHITSAGKCLLAAMPHEELISLYPPNYRWKGGTAAAISSRQELRETLEEVVKDGWAANRAESEVGIIAVATAVRDASGATLGSISVSGPTERIEPRITEIADTLRKAVVEFERDLAGG